MRYETRPLTASRWNDLVAVFGENGACAGCWCMFFRLSGREHTAGEGEVNRARLRALVEAAKPQGVLAYAGGEPVGWAAVSPRAGYARLRRSPLPVGEIDDAGVWALTCLYVPREHRRDGVGHALVDGAVAYAAASGARLVEAYPVDVTKASAAAIYHGTRALLVAHGFAEVARPTERRPVMRRDL